MISASKSTLSLNNLKILRPKVTKNLTNLCKKFYESPPCGLDSRIIISAEMIATALNLKIVKKLENFTIGNISKQG